MLRSRSVIRPGQDGGQTDRQLPDDHRALKSSPVSGRIDHESIREERVLLGAQDL